MVPRKAKRVKRCIQCRKPKPLSDYHRHLRAPAVRCGACRKRNRQQAKRSTRKHAPHESEHPAVTAERERILLAYRQQVARSGHIVHPIPMRDFDAQPLQETTP